MENSDNKQKERNSEIQKEMEFQNKNQLPQGREMKYLVRKPFYYLIIYVIVAFLFCIFSSLIGFLMIPENSSTIGSWLTLKDIAKILIIGFFIPGWIAGSIIGGSLYYYLFGYQ
jgi:hypothetical protein